MCFLKSSAKKKASDVISDLPDGIIENILARMPLKDAVRTSLLSQRWRHSWETLQDLVFDSSFRNIFKQGELVELEPAVILLIVYTVLCQIKAVRKFILSCHPVKSCPAIDNLITLLSRRGIEEFTLHIWEGLPHDLPLCFSSNEKLVCLDLYNCVFPLPAFFKGYSMLVSLTLVEVNITEESLVRLISSCPLLENLKFQTYSVTTYGHIEIDKPGLKVARFIGIFKTVCFKNASRLASVSLYSKGPAGHVIVNEEDTFFSGLPALEDLEICGHYMMSLAAGVSKLPTPRRLRSLKIYKVCLDAQLENSVAHWLMLSPMLQLLRIEVCYAVHFGNPGLKYLEEWQNVYFEQLQDVFVDGLFGTETDLEFLQIILTKSPVLKKMVITLHPHIVDSGFRILQVLSRCERLSPKAKVIL